MNNNYDMTTYIYIKHMRINLFIHKVLFVFVYMYMYYILLYLSYIDISDILS